MYVPGDLAAFALVTQFGLRLVLASFHGDTNGLATIPMMQALFFSSFFSLLASFHGDTNGLARIPMMQARVANVLLMCC